MDNEQLRAEIVALGVLTAEQVDAIAAAPSSWQTLAQRLVDNGVNRADVMAALSAATGLPPAPRAFINPPTSLTIPGAPADDWRRIPAAPVSLRDGTLHILVISSAGANAANNMSPKVRAYVALEEDVLAALDNPVDQHADVVHSPMSQLDLSDDGPAADQVIDLPGEEDMSVELASPHEHVAEMMGQSPGATPELDDGSGIDVVHDAHDMMGMGGAGGAAATALEEAGPDAGSLELGPQTSGEILCGYEVAEKLGEGASAIVFRARKPGDEQDVALKVITKEASREAGFTNRFKREIRSHAALTHPCIVQVTDYGREDGWYFLATEYLPLGDLEVLLSHGTVPPPVVACVIEDVLNGMAFAHERGVVHRDLKPGNILLSPDGHAKVGDFGLAQSEIDPNKSSTGAVRGTPAYMSPEQAMGMTSDGRTDLFSIGTIAYELLTGTNPFRREMGPATMMAVASAKSPPLWDSAPQAPAALEQLIDGLLRREPDDRIASAKDAAALIQPIVEDTASRWPGVVSQYFASPAATRAQLVEAVVQDHLAAARAAAQSGENGRPRAAFEVARALALDPQHAVAQQAWAQLEQAGNFTRGPATLPNLKDAEEHANDNPTDPRALKRAAEAARGANHVVKWAGYLRRYLRFQKDAHAELQLQLLIGDESKAPAPRRAPAQAPAPAATPAPPAAGGGFQPPPNTSSGPQQRPPDANSGPQRRPESASGAQRRPTATGTSLPAPSGGSGKGLLVAAGVALLVVAAGGAWFVTSRNQEALPKPNMPGLTDPPKGPTAPVDPVAARQKKRVDEAKALIEAGKLEQAVAFLTMAIDDNAGSELADQARLLRAQSHLRLGNRGTAQTQLERLLRTAKPDSPVRAAARASLSELTDGDAGPR